MWNQGIVHCLQKFWIMQLSVSSIYSEYQAIKCHSILNITFGFSTIDFDYQNNTSALWGKVTRHSYSLVFDLKKYINRLFILCHINIKIENYAPQHHSLDGLRIIAWKLYNFIGLRDSTWEVVMIFMCIDNTACMWE